jgi:hypothetical protein
MMPHRDSPDEIESAPAGKRRSKPQRSTWPLVMSIVSIAFAVIAAMDLIANREDSAVKTTAATKPAAASPIPQKPETLSDSQDSSESEEVIEDLQGELLWASPTAGPPLSLGYVPAGTQCLLHLRPASMAASPEGERVIAALGPWGQEMLGRLQEILAVKPAEIDSLLIAVVLGPQRQLEAAFRVELKDSWSEEELARRFPRSKEARRGDQDYRVDEARAYFLAKAESPSHTLVVCPIHLADELLESHGDSPPLVRDVEALAEHADSDREATLIIAPKFLEAGGNELLVGEAAPLKEAVHWLLGNDVTAVALSAHWNENFFAELRATPALNVPSRRAAMTVRERIATAPNAVEDIVASADWPPYGRKVLTRFPAMLRTLARFSRAAEDDHQAVVRCYLPPFAGHNLLMGAELLLTQSRSSTAAEAPSPGPTSTAPASLEERLARKTSLVFTKDSLERALEMLAEDTGLKIVIQGSDLQLDGITKNQSLAMDIHDAAASEILVDILHRANPDRTATGPDDPRQKLVYIVEPAQTGSLGRIIVTTRTAAGRRGDPLPAAFVPKKR